MNATLLNPKKKASVCAVVKHFRVWYAVSMEGRGDWCLRMGRDMIGVCHVVCRKERECYLLAFNSVTSTPQWICLREPRNVHDVWLMVCTVV